MRARGRTEALCRTADRQGTLHLPQRTANDRRYRCKSILQFVDRHRVATPANVCKLRLERLFAGQSICREGFQLVAAFRSISDSL